MATETPSLTYRALCKVAKIIANVAFQKILVSYSMAKMAFYLAVFVAQLEERSLQTPEVRGSSPVIGKLYFSDIR